MRFLFVILLFVNSICSAGHMEQKDSVYIVVDEMPEFPGGQQSFNNFISSSLKYPELEKNKGSEGKVFVSFIIDKNGKSINHKVIKSSGIRSFDEEALRVVTNMPDWTPGKQKGQSVKVELKIPIKFQLNLNFNVPIIGKLRPNGLSEFEYFYNKGIETYNESKYLDAGYYFDRALQVNRHDKELLFNKAVVSYRLHKIDSACYYWYATKGHGLIGVDTLIRQYCQAFPPPPVDSVEIFNTVEKMPEFPGGLRELMKYVQTSLVYPKKAKAKDIMGTVYVKFVIEKDGSVGNVVVAKSSGNELLDQEGMRIVKEMPKWSPGIQYDKTVRVMMNLPIKFQLR